jgi:hypothetical protein
VEHGLGMRQRLVDRRVDAEAGALDIARAAFDEAVVDADFHEARRRHLRPMHAEGNLVVAVAAAGHDQGQVVEDAFGEAVHMGQPMGGCEIDPRLPLFSAAFGQGLRRNAELHQKSPCGLAVWRHYSAAAGFRHGRA